MKIVFSKKIAALMLVMGILYLAFGAAFVANAVFESNRFSVFVVICWFMVLVFVGEGVAWILLFHHYRKGTLNVGKSGIMLGIFCFAAPFIMLVWAFVSSLSLPICLLEWPWYLGLLVSLITFIFSLVFVGNLKKPCREGHKGFVLYQNHARAMAIASIWFFLIYLLAVLKAVCLVIMMDETSDPAIVDFSGFMYMGTAIFLAVVSIVFALLILYFGFAQFISGRENIPMELRRGIPVTKKLMAKYEVVFWMSIAASIILGIVALVSVAKGDLGYLGLFILYLIIVIIRVPTFFWRQRIETKYQGDDYRIFQEKHRILLYIGINLIALGIISCFLGMGFAKKLSQDYDPMMVYAVFLPYSVIRIILGIFSFRKAHKIGDPYLRTSSYIDVMAAIFVMANTVYMLASLYSSEAAISQGWLIAGKCISYAMNVYVIVVAIQTIVIGILGLLGKRKKFYDGHEGPIKKVNSLRFEKIIQNAPLQEEAGLSSDNSQTSI